MIRKTIAWTMRPLVFSGNQKIMFDIVPDIPKRTIVNEENRNVKHSKSFFSIVLPPIDNLFL